MSANELIQRRGAMMQSRSGGIDWESELAKYATGGTSLTSVTIPASVTSLRSYAFYQCASLQSVTYLGSPTLGSGTFIGCNAITDIRDVLPSGITNLPTETFRQCNGLVEVIVPDGVQSTSLGWIYGSNIESVTYPSSMLTIGGNSSSFGWAKITEIVILATTPPTLGNATSSLGAYTLTFPIYVPDDSVNTYKTAYANYSNRITKLSDRPTT